jgi:hypothetical protein
MPLVKSKGQISCFLDRLVSLFIPAHAVCKYVVTLVSRWLNTDMVVFGQLVEVRHAVTADAMIAETFLQSTEYSRKQIRTAHFI